MDFKQELQRITSIYFEDTFDYEALSIASKEYKELLLSLSNENIILENFQDSIHLENGIAIGTLWAASCIDDFARTKKFIKGIDIAIQEKIHQEKTLHILYAGTGPFATLLLPIIIKYLKPNIQYTLLEINPISFKILEKVIQKLGLNTVNITLVNDDATKYKIPNHLTPNLIISETMLRALDKEQQVSIYYNLMSQVSSNTIFIPEKIALYIGLKTGEKHFKKLNNVFEVCKKTMNSTDWTLDKASNKLTFTKNQTIIDRKELSNANQIVVITEITVYRDIKIKVNESGLTTPKYIKAISSNNNNEDIIIDSQYIIDTDPKLSLQLSSTKVE
ncbi:hypothetical protein [Tenacibaculum sp.]|uniref:hypothetical protein n=1 Tax=Tenacibaculum sp. TaxID=1906242 RepID=UPI003D0A0C0F